MADEIEITPETRAAATEQDALPMMETVLLGTLIGPDGPRAILRNGFGGVETVEVGSRAYGGEVTAIREGEIFFSRGGRGVKLEMPRS